MEYPRELPADSGDVIPVTAAINFEPGIQLSEQTTTAMASQRGNESLSVVRGCVGRIEDKNSWSSLEPRLSRSILVLRNVLESGTNALASNRNGEKANIDRVENALLTADFAMLRTLLRSEGGSETQLTKSRMMQTVETLDAHLGEKGVPKVENVADPAEIGNSVNTASRILAAATHQNISASRLEVCLVAGAKSSNSTSGSQANASVDICEETVTNSIKLTSDHLQEVKSNSSPAESSTGKNEKKKLLIASAEDILGHVDAKEIISDALGEADLNSGRIVTAATLANAAEEGRNVVKLSSQRRTELQNMANDLRR